MSYVNWGLIPGCNDSWRSGSGTGKMLPNPQTWCEMTFYTRKRHVYFDGKHGCLSLTETSPILASGSTNSWKGKKSPNVSSFFHLTGKSLQLNVALLFWDSLLWGNYIWRLVLCVKPYSIRKTCTIKSVVHSPLMHDEHPPVTYSDKHHSATSGTTFTGRNKSSYELYDITRHKAISRHAVTYMKSAPYKRLTLHNFITHDQISYYG